MHIMPFHRFSDSIMIIVLYINQLADNFLADSFVYQKQPLTIRDRRSDRTRFRCCSADSVFFLTV